MCGALEDHRRSDPVSPVLQGRWRDNSWTPVIAVDVFVKKVLRIARAALVKGHLWVYGKPDQAVDNQTTIQMYEIRQSFHL